MHFSHKIHQALQPGWLFLLWLCITVPAVGQQKSTTPGTPVKYVTDEDYVKSRTFTQSDFQGHLIDTSITGFQNYYPRNSNGQFGTPSANLLFQYKRQDLGFRLYDLPYKNDIISEDQVLFCRTKGPYASLTGIAGSKQEQWFKLFFSHTFKNGINLTLGFNRYSGLGFYQRQQSFTNNFYVSSNYTSTSNRWGYNFYFLLNKLKHQENGGIQSDSLILQGITVNKDLVPVNISNARRTNRLMTVSANPWVRLNKIQDSSTRVSHYVDYEFKFRGNFYDYADLSSGTDNYYHYYYLDTISTNDSTHLKQVSNQVNYTLRIHPLNLALKVGYRNEYTLLHQYVDTALHNNLAIASLAFGYKAYQLNVNGSYIVSGSNQNDYQLEAANTLSPRLFKSWKHPLVLSLNAMVEQRHPDYIYNRWYSNHFIWNNHYSPVQTQQVSFAVASKDLRLKIGGYLQNVGNYLYFDQGALPRQYNKMVQMTSCFIQKDLLLFKHLGFDNTLVMQSTSASDVVRIPSFVAYSRLYFQGQLFHRNLWLQTGFQADYYSSFTGYAYMPATNIYYLQNTKSSGNYPFIDFFLSARIRPVRVFVKIDHVFQGMLGNNYSLTANYYQPDRAFKFGINWVFFD